MTDTELQALALKKYNKILMGNGSESRSIKLYSIHNLFTKSNLSAEDRFQLQHFVDASREDIDRTAYVANTVVSPMSWGHATTMLPRKRITKE